MAVTAQCVSLGTQHGRSQAPLSGLLIVQSHCNAFGALADRHPYMVAIDRKNVPSGVEIIERL